MNSLSQTNRQSGAALITALIILLFMMIIGTAGMEQTVTEEKMITNFRDRTMALNAADSTLRASEAWLKSQKLTPEPKTTTSCTTTARPMCGATTGYTVWDDNQLVAITDNWGTKTWDWWKTNGIVYRGSGTAPSTLGDKVAGQPVSAIEFRSFNSPNSKGIASTLNPDDASQGKGWHYYNVMGAGTGYRAETMAVIETTLKKLF